MLPEHAAFLFSAVIAIAIITITAGMSGFFANFASAKNISNPKIPRIEMITQEQLKETFERKLALRRYL